jgi:hypothetical protein
MRLLVEMSFKHSRKTISAGTRCEKRQFSWPLSVAKVPCWSVRVVGAEDRPVEVASGPSNVI